MRRGFEFDQKRMLRDTNFDEISNVRWCHTMERLVSEEYKYNAILDWKSMKLATRRDDVAVFISPDDNTDSNVLNTLQFSES